MNATEMINDELARAGENVAEQQMLEDLEGLRITPDKEIPPMQFLFQMFCKPCFPRGELVAISGKAKSGKTFVCSILMALCFKDEILTVRRTEESPLSVLWYDTEQSEESTQDILKNRIMPMTCLESFPVDMFHIFNVRSRFWNERLPMLEFAMRRFQPDIVVLDGIRDLVNDINDGVMAQEVIERLMHLASKLNCCLVCILHQNKSTDDKNLRGWIGTELKNKAFEVYDCVKDADRIFTWSQTETRKYDIVDKLKYVVGEDGIPRLCAIELLSGNSGPLNASSMSRPFFTEKYVLERVGNKVVLDVKTLFADAFEWNEQLGAADLQQRVMQLANITSAQFYNKRREDALASGVIVQQRDRNSKIVYTCPSKQGAVQTAIDFAGDSDDTPF